jgi:hypothetical protein
MIKNNKISCTARSVLQKKTLSNAIVFSTVLERIKLLCVGELHSY